MPRYRRGRAVALWLAAALLPVSALAHPGHEDPGGFAAALAHPWTGLDHMAAMLAVGIWAAYMGRRSVIALFCATAAGITAGALLGAISLSLAAGEPMIIVSVIVIGLFAVTAARARTSLAALLVGLFSVFHGCVQAVEIPREASTLAFSAGFLVSMLAIQLLGVTISATLPRLTGPTPAASPRD